MIVEPVAGNMGCVPPRPGFLQALRRLATEHGCVLIFDEVIAGFRVARGGAQQLYGVEPDLTTLGKIIGGGLPVGASGGKAALMELVAPAGPVYQAGTLSGNPLAVAAGLKTLEIVSRPNFYARLEESSRQLETGLLRGGQKAGVAIAVNRVGSMLTVFFGPGPVEDYAGALRSGTAMFGRFFRALLEHGVYWPPSQFECALVSAAHSPEDIEQSIAAAAAAMRMASES